MENSSIFLFTFCICFSLSDLDTHTCRRVFQGNINTHFCSLPDSHGPSFSDFIPWSNKADGQRIKWDVSDLHLSSYVSLAMMQVSTLGCKGTLLLPSLPSSPKPSCSLVSVLSWTLFLRSSSAAQRNSDLFILSVMTLFRAGISPAPVAYCLLSQQKAFSSITFPIILLWI